MKGFFYALRAFCGAAVAAWLAVACPAPQEEFEITADLLKKHLFFLASDELAGRNIGTPGIARAEEYIADTFRGARMNALDGHRDYFFDFTLYKYSFDEYTSRLDLFTGGEKYNALFEADFVPLYNSGSGWREGNLVFAGYGITAPEFGYDDYTGLDVRGKIVLLLRGEPGFFHKGSAEQQAWTRFAYHELKIKNAHARGAQAVLIATGPRTRLADPGGFTAPSLVAAGEFASGATRPGGGLFPAALVSDAFAHRLFSLLPSDIAQIQDALERGQKPSAFRIDGASAIVSVWPLPRPATLAARNVAAVRAGACPASDQTWIVVGAHHDHLGSFRGTGDTIFNGADDNASGTAALLALAEAFSCDPTPRAHGFFFITFSAEEKGLLGSKAFIGQNHFGPDRVRFMCNLDMIGRNPQASLEVIIRAREDTARMAREYLEARGVTVRVVDANFHDAMSDDYSFAVTGVETFFFFSGLHEDYHGVDDEADRIDYNVMEARVRLIYDFLVFLDSSG